MRILFCCNTLHGFCNFRLDVVNHLVGKGIEAVIVFPYKEGDEKIVQALPAGCRAIECKMSPTGKSFSQDFRYLVGLMRILGKEKPDIVFNYTVKPNIYGGIAARVKGIPSVAVAPGLGYVFAKNGVIGSLLRKFYVAGLGLAKTVFVLNSSDRDCLLKAGLKKEKVILLEGGEGVDLKRYPFREGKYLSPRFLMISRLLYSKGYREFATVARKVKADYPEVSFEIAGLFYEQNPDGVPQSVVQKDVGSGSLNYLGYIEDITSELTDPNTVVVLPSYYREGMNRSLMEACSCGRPVITSNLPGLRELVSDGVNGYLVEPKNPDSLYDKINSFLQLPLERKVQMGYQSRKIAQKRFDVESVKTIYARTISKILKINV